MDRISAIERLLLGLAEQTRLRILSILNEGEASVSAITKSLGVAQPKVSRHLAYLKDSGIAAARRDGKQIFYSLARDPRSASIVTAVIRELSSPEAEVHNVNSMDSVRSPEPSQDIYATSHTSRRENDIETYLL